MIHYDNPEFEELLQHRGREIARVLASQMVSHNVQTALERLRRLECKSATSLVLQYRLSAFDKVVKSRPESVPAVYESDLALPMGNPARW